MTKALLTTQSMPRALVGTGVSDDGTTSLQTNTGVVSSTLKVGGITNSGLTSTLAAANAVHIGRTGNDSTDTLQAAVYVGRYDTAQGYGGLIYQGGGAGAVGSVSIVTNLRNTANTSTFNAGGLVVQKDSGTDTSTIYIKGDGGSNLLTLNTTGQLLMATTPSASSSNSVEVTSCGWVRTHLQNYNSGYFSNTNLRVGTSGINATFSASALTTSRAFTLPDLAGEFVVKEAVSGNVFVGSTTDDGSGGKLQVNGTTHSTRLLVGSQNYADAVPYVQSGIGFNYYGASASTALTGGTMISMYRAAGTDASPTQTLVNMNLGGIQVGAYDGATWRSTGYLVGKALEAQTSTGWGMEWQLNAGVVGEGTRAKVFTAGAGNAANSYKGYIRVFGRVVTDNLTDDLTNDLQFNNGVGNALSVKQSFTVGSTGAGTGGYTTWILDSGLSKWKAGVQAGVSTTRWQLYDVANAREIMGVDATTGKLTCLVLQPLRV